MVLFVVYMCYTDLDLSFDMLMLFSMVYAKLLKMVLL